MAPELETESERFQDAIDWPRDMDKAPWVGLLDEPTLLGLLEKTVPEWLRDRGLWPFPITVIFERLKILKAESHELGNNEPGEEAEWVLNFRVKDEPAEKLKAWHAVDGQEHSLGFKFDTTIDGRYDPLKIVVDGKEVDDSSADDRLPTMSLAPVGMDLMEVPMGTRVFWRLITKSATGDFAYAVMFLVIPRVDILFGHGPEGEELGPGIKNLPPVPAPGDDEPPEEGEPDPLDMAIRMVQGLINYKESPQEEPEDNSPPI